MKVEIKDGKLYIEMDIHEHPSKSGKTTVIASTNGNNPTTATYKDKVVILGLNAYIAKG